MKVIYRISDNSYDKIKPSYITKESCLLNAMEVFNKADWLIIADKVNDKTCKLLQKSGKEIIYTDLGNGAKTFKLALDKALESDDDEIIYFLEDDYLHRENAYDVLVEGFMTGADFVSLYDHPDKYNKLINSKIYLTDSTHWRTVPSTTMTFAVKRSTLDDINNIFYNNLNDIMPLDSKIFKELKEQDKTLISVLPGYATHGETNFLTLLINWSEL